ncbi:MAG UNVERIFIED_CONTAM: hypothetical protein LVR29_27065 [Microcystis novacekii LVE1205-3]
MSSQLEGQRKHYFFTVYFGFSLLDYASSPAFDRYPDSVSLTLEPVATDSQKFDLYLTLHLTSSNSIADSSLKCIT